MQTLKEPTLRQLEVLRAIWDMTMEMGWPPSMRELNVRMGRTSTNGMSELLNRVQRNGWIVRENMQSRCLRLTKAGHALIGSPPGHPYLKD